MGIMSYFYIRMNDLSMLKGLAANFRIIINKINRLVPGASKLRSNSTPCQWEIMKHIMGKEVKKVNRSAKQAAT